MPSLSLSDLNQGTASAYVDIFNSPAGRASLAMTTPEYPVTPGDIYTLTFITANGVVTSPIIVDANFGVNLANVGKVDAETSVSWSSRRRWKRRYWPPIHYLLLN